MSKSRTGPDQDQQNFEILGPIRTGWSRRSVDPCIQDTNVDSIYSRLVQRNRCNLNDYQNQANNGCKSKSMADKTIFGLNRKPTDKPMLVFLSLIGNDVCNGKVGWLNRCWWRMMETKCVGDNLKVLVTVLAILATNIIYLLTLASGTNIQKTYRPIS